MARTSITIDLELDGETDSLSGSARLPDGTSRGFHGWLGLAEAIEVLARTHVGVSAVAQQSQLKGRHDRID